jgi:hypothetical protein
MIENVDPVPFHQLMRDLYDAILEAPIVDVGEWQSQLQPHAPQSHTAEVLNTTFSYAIPADPRALGREVMASQPWAEDHFLERISGQPLNPPPSSKYWRFAVRGHAQHTEDTKFSHTYPERMWPKLAGRYTGDVTTDAETVENHGIRYDYGDLLDVAFLLSSRPYTRQAFLPIWFPEDTGAAHGQRVPCTLGYHFLIRTVDGKRQLQITYYIRSCDLYRHFRDDVYMACRLAQWMVQMVHYIDPIGKEGLHVGQLLMHIVSLHVFEADLPVIKTLRARLDTE